MQPLRLTLDQNKPYLDSDITSNTLYAVPCNGNELKIGSIAYPFSSLSLDVSAYAANSQHDAFIGANSLGNIVLVSSPMGGPAVPGTTTYTKITGGTPIGGMTARGGLAASFDGVTSQLDVVSSASGAPVFGYDPVNTIGFDWGSSKLLGRVKCYSPSDEGFRGDRASIPAKIQGWTGSGWIDLWTGTAPGGVGAILDVTFSAMGCTQGQVLYQGNTTNWIRNAEAEFYEAITTGGTPATGRSLERYNGVLTNSAAIGDISARQAIYVGSFLIDPSGGSITCHFSYGPSRRFGVWNLFNQIQITMKAGIDFPLFPTSPVPGSTGYTPAPTYPSWGLAAQDYRNSLTVFTGIKQSPVKCEFTNAWRVTYLNGGGAAAAQIFGAIGWNSTDTPSGTWIQGNGENFSTASGKLVIGAVGQAVFISPPCEGVNVVTALESKQGNDWNVWCLENNMALTASYMG